MVAFDLLDIGVVWRLTLDNKARGGCCRRVLGRATSSSELWPSHDASTDLGLLLYGMSGPSII